MSDHFEFEIVDPPKVEEKKPTEAEKASLFESILMGKDITTKVTTSRGDFVVKYPTGKDLGTIDRIKAMRRNGISADSFDALAGYTSTVYATLDVVVIKGPEWFEKAKKDKPNFSFEGVPDDELINELYSRALDFRNNVQGRIKSEREDTKEASFAGPKETVDDGAISGIAHGPTT